MDPARRLHVRGGRAQCGSIQYNKGQWSNRPVQLRGGDTVVSLGGDRVGSAAEFLSAMKRHRGLGPGDLVDAGVLRRDANNAGRYEYQTVRLDPGDLQLMYGVYSAKRR